MNPPHFLVVGTARAGTTSLHHYLQQHPGLFLPKLKEPCFYCFAGEKIKYKFGKFSFAINDPKKYQELFKEADERKVCGEISTPYLYLYHKTIENIFKYHPHPEQLKILILLRNPVDRAFSQYMWKVRDGREELSFEEAIRLEPERKKHGFSFDYFYVNRGLYYQQVKAYVEKFKQVKILLLEDLKADPLGMLKEVCAFLGVDESFHFRKAEEMNVSYLPRWKFLSRIVTVESRTKFRILNQIPETWNSGIRKQFMQWNTSRNSRQELNSSTRMMLQNIYRDDLQKLQQLINRDLSAWINP